MPEYYRIYGQRLRSNLALSGLVIDGPSSVIDIEVLFDEKPQLEEAAASMPWYIGDNCDHGKPNLVVWKIPGFGFHLRYADGTEFFVNSIGDKVWATWPESLTLEDTAIYFEGPVLGFVLRLRGTTCLHASAIAVDQQAIAIVGPAGAGKSTTAAALSTLGYPVISEDVVALSRRDGKVFVEPGYPRIRLWPTSFETPYGQSDALPPLTPTWDKRYLDLSTNGYRFQREASPLSAIYMLGERSAEPNAPFIEDLPTNSRLVSLVANTYTNYMLTSAMRSDEFELLGKMVRSLPMKKVVPHQDPRYLPKLCEVIVEDFARSKRDALSLV